MRIVMVNTYHFLRGGDSRCALVTANELRERGHEVTPFAMRHRENIDSSWERYYPDEIDFPALMARKTPGALWTVLSSSIYNRAARQGLARLLDDHPADLVHLHSVMHHLTASVALECHARGMPLVWTLHDYKAVCPTTHFLREGKICEACSGGRFFNALRYRCKRGSLGASAIVTAELYLHRLWSVYEKADLLIAPSSFLRNKLLEHGLRPRRIEVLENFVDTDALSPSHRDDGYVLYVGRLSREKGPLTLVEATSDILGCEVRIAGTGELESELKRLCGARGFTHVRFEGHCSGDRLRNLYEGARLLAIPSECYENCPLVVLEAFAYGKPVVGTALGGLRDMIEPGRTGALVEAANVGAWRETLSMLLADPERCRTMGEEARRVAESRYSRSRHLRQLETWYRELRGASLA